MCLILFHSLHSSHYYEQSSPHQPPVVGIGLVVSPSQMDSVLVVDTGNFALACIVSRAIRQSIMLLNVAVTPTDKGVSVLVSFPESITPHNKSPHS